MQTNLFKTLAILSLIIFSFKSSAQVKKKSLSDLKWMQGTWVGENNDGTKFSETYNYISDTLIKITYFFDAAQNTPTNYGSITIEDGHMYHTFDNSRWVLEENKNGILKFIPIKDASNEFTWSYMDDSSWRAVLIFEDGTKNTFTMKRLY